MFEQRCGREVIFKVHFEVSSLFKGVSNLRTFDTRPRRWPEEVKELKRRVVLVRLLDIANITATWMCKDEGMANNKPYITSTLLRSYASELYEVCIVCRISSKSN